MFNATIPSPSTGLTNQHPSDLKFRRRPTDCSRISSCSVQLLCKYSIRFPCSNIGMGYICVVNYRVLVAVCMEVPTKGGVVML